MEEEVQFAWDVGVCEVIFECDSMIVAEVLLDHDEPPMAIRDITDEGIRHKLQDFDSFKLHISRGKTIVQHTYWLIMPRVLMVMKHG